MKSNDEEQRSAELTEQEIDAFANIDFDMPSSRVRSRIFFNLGAFGLLFLWLYEYFSS